jgi:hypothetical protein
MKLYRLVVNDEPTTYTAGGKDPSEALQRLASTHKWLHNLIDETDTDPARVYLRQNTKISLEEVK